MSPTEIMDFDRSQVGNHSTSTYSRPHSVLDLNTQIDKPHLGEQYQATLEGHDIASVSVKEEEETCYKEFLAANGIEIKTIPAETDYEDVACILSHPLKPDSEMFLKEELDHEGKQRATEAPNITYILPQIPEQDGETFLRKDLEHEEKRTEGIWISASNAARQMEEQKVNEEEEEEEEMAVSSQPLARPKRALPLAPASTTWQLTPGPPPKKWPTATASPAWDFFRVPTGSTKASAKYAQCILCVKNISRGESSQARGTTSMLRHLFSNHWEEMSPEFQTTYQKARRRALRLEPLVKITPLTSATEDFNRTLPATDPTILPSSPIDVSNFSLGPKF